MPCTASCTATSGRGWIGIAPRGAYETEEVRVVTLLPGWAWLLLVARLQPHAALLLLTGAADLDTALRAVNQVGVFRYLTKPWHDEDLVAHLQAALDHSQALQQQALAADAWVSEHGQLSPQEAERHRLEALDPGITHVQWGPGGEVLMPALTPAPTTAPTTALTPHKASNPGRP